VIAWELLINIKWGRVVESDVAGHELDALDPARDEIELLDAVVNVGLVVHNVGVGVVRCELAAHSLRKTRGGQ